MAGGAELQTLEYHGTGAVLAPVLVARKLPQNLKTFSNVGELMGRFLHDFFSGVNFHLCSFGEKYATTWESLHLVDISPDEKT